MTTDRGPQERSEAELWEATAGDGEEQAWAPWELHLRLAEQDTFDRAAITAERSAELFAGLGQASEAAHARYGQAACLQRLGRGDEAAAAAGTALDGFMELGDEEWAGRCQRRLAALAARAGRAGEALDRWLAAEALCSSG